jgi:hypothetical protein
LTAAGVLSSALVHVHWLLPATVAVATLYLWRRFDPGGSWTVPGAAALWLRRVAYVSLWLGAVRIADVSGTALIAASLYRYHPWATVCLDQPFLCWLAAGALIAATLLLGLAVVLLVSSFVLVWSRGRGGTFGSKRLYRWVNRPSIDTAVRRPGEPNRARELPRGAFETTRGAGGQS